MLLDLGLKALMLFIGYRYLAPYFEKEQRVWGIGIGLAIVFVLQMLQSYIHPWPFGIPILLSAYVAYGVGVNGLFKREKPDDNGGGNDSQKPM